MAKQQQPKPHITWQAIQFHFASKWASVALVKLKKAVWEIYLRSIKNAPDYIFRVCCFVCRFLCYMHEKLRCEIIPYRCSEFHKCRKQAYYQLLQLCNGDITLSETVEKAKIIPGNYCFISVLYNSMGTQRTGKFPACSQFSLLFKNLIRFVTVKECKVFMHCTMDGRFYFLQRCIRCSWSWKKAYFYRVVICKIFNCGM